MNQALFRLGVGVLAAGWFSSALFGEVSPAPFRDVAPIEGELQPNAPARLPLPRGVLAETFPDFSDLRILDDQGTETPYVIYPQVGEGRTEREFLFQVLNFREEGPQIEILLERPAEIQAFQAVEFRLDAKNFRKFVRIEASPDRKDWTEIARDAIFDFSERIDLRRTRLDFPQNADQRFLKITLSEEQDAEAGGKNIELRYEGLEFTVKGAGLNAPFHIMNIAGFYGQKIGASRGVETAEIALSGASLDKDRNTILPLGRVNLPLYAFSLEVENVYYHRRLELQAAEKDEENAYRAVAQGTVYQMPGMRQSSSSVSCEGARGTFMRLKIYNGNNPPLRISRLKVSWIRRHLYFVPETGRTYRLYFGAAGMPFPQYELAALLPTDFGQLSQFQEARLGTIQDNPLRETLSQATSKENLKVWEKGVFTAVILLAAALLAFWFFQLIKKLPANKESGGEK